MKLVLLFALTSVVLAQECSTTVYERCKSDISDFRRLTCQAPPVSNNADWGLACSCISYLKVLETCYSTNCLLVPEIKDDFEADTKKKGIECKKANLTSVPKLPPWLNQSPPKPDVISAPAPVTTAAPITPKPAVVVTPTVPVGTVVKNPSNGALEKISAFGAAFTTLFLAMFF